MDSVKRYFIKAIPKAAEDLVAAFDRIPEDRRTWSPTADARTAIDQLAEVALLNGNAAKILRTRDQPQVIDFAEFMVEKVALSKDLDSTKALLKTNTESLLAEIENIPDSDLEKLVEMPWGPMTVTQIIAYPFWNSSYHEGQINYIASMLGRL